MKSTHNPLHSLPLSLPLSYLSRSFSSTPSLFRSSSPISPSLHTHFSNLSPSPFFFTSHPSPLMTSSVPPPTTPKKGSSSSSISSPTSVTFSPSTPSSNSSSLSSSSSSSFSSPSTPSSSSSSSSSLSSSAAAAVSAALFSTSATTSSPPSSPPLYLSHWIGSAFTNILHLTPPPTDLTEVSRRYQILNSESPPTRQKFQSLLSSFSPVKERKHYDAIIVGGGIVGLSCAYHLIQQWGKRNFPFPLDTSTSTSSSHVSTSPPLRICLIESQRVASGTTSHSTSKFTSNHKLLATFLSKTKSRSDALKYLQMNEKSINDVEKIIGENQIKCQFKRVPHVTWTNDLKQVEDIKLEAELASESGIKAEFLSSKDAMGKILPSSIPMEAAVVYHDQGQLNVYEFCLGIVRNIVERGGIINENSTVLDVSNDSPHRVVVRNELLPSSSPDSEMELTSDIVILATHLPILDRSMHFAMFEPSRTHCISFEVESKEEKSSIHGNIGGTSKTIPTPFPMSINDLPPTRSMREGDSPNVFILCGESYPQGDCVNTDEKYENLEKWARDHFNVKKVLTRWSAMDFISKDGLPHIGQLYRGTSTIFTATAFSKWGLTNGWASGSIITDIILNKENEYSPMVSPLRWDMSSLGGFVSEGIHTAKHFLKDKAKKVMAKGIGSLQPNEGGVVSLGSSRVGAFCDENRKYHLVVPQCSHLGCDVVFNNGDKQWQCPCHGSTFDIDGKMMHGPAVKHITIGKADKIPQEIDIIAATEKGKGKGKPKVEIQW